MTPNNWFAWLYSALNIFIILFVDLLLKFLFSSICIFFFCIHYCKYNFRFLFFCSSLVFPNMIRPFFIVCRFRHAIGLTRHAGRAPLNPGLGHVDAPPFSGPRLSGARPGYIRPLPPLYKTLDRIQSLEPDPQILVHGDQSLFNQYCMKSIPKI